MESRRGHPWISWLRLDPDLCLAEIINAMENADQMLERDR